MREGCQAPLGGLDAVGEDALSAKAAALTTLTGSAPILDTGDNPRAAARLASEVGITDVRAGLLPQDKVTAVQDQEKAGRKVLVIGDGVNDAPALAAAHTGIAMGRAGSDLALETADAVIVRDELATVPTVVALSRRARQFVVQNLAIASVFITGLVIWDLPGHLPLPLGVLGREGWTTELPFPRAAIASRDGRPRHVAPVHGRRHAGSGPAASAWTCRSPRRVGKASSGSVRGQCLRRSGIRALNSPGSPRAPAVSLPAGPGPRALHGGPNWANRCT